MEAKTAETMKGLAVTTIRSIRQKVASLSGGQRQSVAVARAVMWNSKLVILDEPTAALGVAQTRQVLDLVKRLADQGLAVVIISHNLHDIFEVADRITVLRLGRSVAVFDREGDDPGGGRPRDHGRRPDQGRRRTGHGSVGAPRRSRRGGANRMTTELADPTRVRPRSPRPGSRATASGRISAAGGRVSARATSAACRSSSPCSLITIFFQSKNHLLLERRATSPT